MGQSGLRFLISDSWEAGAQNWTDRDDRRSSRSAAATIRIPGCRC